MPYIQTVLGIVEVNEEIGHFQPHEHLSIEAGNASKINPALCIDNLDTTITEVKDFLKQGGKVIADAQPIGSGRKAADLVNISKITGVHIIASTGFHKKMFYHHDHWIHHFSSEQLLQVMLTEINHGMYIGNQSCFPTSTIDARAGLIKTAVDHDGISNKYNHKFNAAAEASFRTGVPIMVHIEKGSDPFEVITFLTDLNIPPNRIILCHLDRTHHDYQLHEAIARTGVFLEYDTIGRFKYHDDETEIKLILNMLKQGFEDSLLLSLDTTKSRLRAYGGEIGLSYLLTSFLPKLEKKGVSKEIIHLLTQKNPAKALAIDK
ncbi:phosphotriesterase [Metabacillus litoralis]|uniref:phosphotriesterase family protein n=1 Tax=Metabacillus TaxID=2675233 RepID=UPI0013CF15F4|nr:hypothetical protein [Metabacillus litoralis]MCM3161443.1 hypothetical protein [Metabacillus litoralis]